MAHKIESLYYTREKPWHGLGTRVEEAPTSADALRLAGLDWKVEAKPVFTETGEVIQNYKANTRDSDGAVLGLVSDRYTICQNDEAFAFTDALVGGGNVRYETAGSLSGGRRIWLLAKMPNAELAGDEVEPYMCFTNTHDGSGAIRVCMTPVRVVCNNTLNFALRTAKRSWSTKHTGKVTERIVEAEHALELAGKYMDGLAEYADRMANTPLRVDQIRSILDELFPATEEDSERVQETARRIKNEYMVCYFMPDLEKFRGTAWGALNAMADMVDHNAPKRQTQNYAENNWARIIDGHYLVDAMAQRVSAAL